MSLEDFFNKKSRKKTKKTINAQELFEQITDGPLRQKTDPEKCTDEMVVTNSDDIGEWEPIVNDDIELDFSNIRINDLATIKVEEEQAAASNINPTSKADDSKVVWGGKVKKEDPEIIEESTPKSNVYVPLPFRSARSNPKPLPNLESTEEFPTLDAAAQEKSKKNVSTDSRDSSWVEVSRSSVPRRKEGLGVSGSSYASSNSYREDTLSHKHSSFGFRDSYSSRGVASSSGGAWSRGEALKNKPVSSADSLPASKMSPWERKPTPSSGVSKPYVVHQQRDILSFTQENRFAQLDNS